MALLIIGSVPCPIDSGHMVSAGISREGQGAAIHLICSQCAVNIQVKRSSPLGQRLIAEARGVGTPPEAISDAPPADEPEPTETPDLEPEPAPAEETAPAAVAPTAKDPYLATTY